MVSTYEYNGLSRQNVSCLLRNPFVSGENFPWQSQSLLVFTIRSHGTRSHILRRKLHSGTFKTKVGQGRLVRVAMVWKSHCATSVPACVIFYHVTASCKEPILTWLDRSSSVSGGLGKSGRRHSVSLCMSRVRPSKSRSNDYSSICPLSTM